MRTKLKPRVGCDNPLFSAIECRKLPCVVDRSTLNAWLITCALVILTGFTFARVTELEFVRFDDPAYVTANPQVQEGLTIETVEWAFTTGFMSNWHPVTWLSHMVDVELYGLEPAGHHATSALLHVLNVLLLFALLRTMTGSTWRSAVVAALFAVHPLRVESVAWVSERKDVLSTFFGLLSAFAYVAYTRNGGAARYITAALLLAVGLMAKPMLVTLPAVFLLLDYWPLNRWRVHAKPASKRQPKSAGPPLEPRAPALTHRELILEKLPLLALVIASSAITYFVQDAGNSVVEWVPLHLRLANAVTSYAGYLAHTIWPLHLGLLYPHPYMAGGTPLALWQITTSCLLLFLVTGAAWKYREQRFFAVGWLWYLGTLLPTIGLIQVGRQAMADRYTYLPLVGIFIVAVWGGALLVEKLPRAARNIAIVGVVVLIALLSLRTRFQVDTWHDARSVVEHALSVSPSSMMHYNLGNIFVSEKDYEAAAEQYRAAIEIEPLYANANMNLASSLYELGRYREAIPYYQAAVPYSDEPATAVRGIGHSLTQLGDLKGAAEVWKQLQAMEQASTR